ncbi:Styryl dye vacuolar localization protein 3 [Cyberlindnera jadinii]|uniref:Styryl dye vacuolar localization protein 3 n=1 Tax=Cyberlindnera jadinii (strain ATCC 18201 / CBS 1600 / BCRC 20928 / JCM 3617 / NBRC 0987 / NRRL Y-1542) TaxID=983966 RepID=A0A0H5C7E7_CYBJN|nr:Styryl dye vacuolar localization protein 3 [Cyberlindnera jadinii]
MTPLTLLAVGDNPRLLFYTLQFQKTDKFTIHLVNSTLAINEKVKLNDDYFDPQFIHNSLDNVAKVEFDVVIISAGSLQQMSTLSAQLAPYLGKTTIVLVESTGFVNLEPFVKNCLTQKPPVFSLMTPLDVRSLGTRNEFAMKGEKKIFIGQSGTLNAKYPQRLQTDLNALATLLKVDSVEVITKQTHLEFLVEQWKLALPRICFDPLLIMFEEPVPQLLTNQILAKPLLSGLITEMITVAKTMGCKLPAGYDSESSLLKLWSSWYKDSTNTDTKPRYANSPELFYNFYHKNDLQVDMLLLQPILLADDHSIKTPYLEFLYATICEFNKFNTKPSLFFKRNDGVNDSELKNELNKMKNSLAQHASEYKTLLKQNEQLQLRLDERERSLSSVDSLRGEHQQLQQAYQNKSRLLSSSEQQIQQLKLQIDKLEQQAQHHQVELLRAKNEVKTSTPASSTYEVTPVSTSTFVQRSADVSDNGTPDLRDLTDVALISASMDPVQPPSPAIPQGPPPPLPHSSSSGSQSPILNGGDLSAREIELHKKEAALASKEQELNRKLSHTCDAKDEASTASAASSATCSTSPVAAPAQFTTTSPSFTTTTTTTQQQHQHQHQQQPQQLQQPGFPRRATTTDIYTGIPADLSSHQFKPTSRKNRKSSMPLSAALGASPNYATIPVAPRSASGGHVPASTTNHPNNFSSSNLNGHSTLPRQ